MSYSRYLFASLLVCLPVAAQTSKWTTPTAAELSMTSIPQVPGAPAVMLYKELVSDDSKTFQYYCRIKVLTEAGKEYATVELPSYVKSYIFGYVSIEGRTVQPDGSVVPFAGKPYERLVSKGKGYQVTQKVFTLPAVQAGSILEYRIKTVSPQYYGPVWTVQGGLFVVKAHFTLRPPPVPLEESATEKLVTRIAWTSNLPAGSHVVSVNKDSYTQFQLDIANVPPLPEEDDMPPLDSLGYRVNFFFSAYKSGPEYWQAAGKTWSKERDHFIGPGSAVKHTVGDLFAPGDSDEQKVRKIYAAIGALENTDYTRRHSAAEDKVEGLKQIATTDDILKRKRGNSNQLTDLLVAMVRAAGLKAYRPISPIVPTTSSTRLISTSIR